MKSIKHTLLTTALAGVLGGGLLATVPANADSGYAVTSDNQPVATGSGGCVHTGRWQDSMPTCPEPQVVVDEDHGMIVFSADDSEFFGFDKVKLSDDVKADLDSVVNAVDNADLIHGITITGHADRVGPAKFNEDLALRRAEAVKDYLVSKGIPADRVQAVSQGDAAPLVTCPNIHNAKKLARCLAPNRRVDVQAVLADGVDLGSVTIIAPPVTTPTTQNL